MVTETRMSSASDQHSQERSLRQGGRESSFCCPSWYLGTSKVKADELGGGGSEKSLPPWIMVEEELGIRSWARAVKGLRWGCGESRGRLDILARCAALAEDLHIGSHCVRAQRLRLHPREGGTSISLFQPGKSIRKCQCVVLPALWRENQVSMGLAYVEHGIDLQHPTESWDNSKGKSGGESTLLCTIFRGGGQASGVTASSPEETLLLLRWGVS